MIIIGTGELLLLLLVGWLLGRKREHQLTPLNILFEAGFSGLAWSPWCSCNLIKVAWSHVCSSTRETEAVANKYPIYSCQTQRQD